MAITSIHKRCVASLLITGLLFGIAVHTSYAQEERSILPVEYHDTILDNAVFWSDRMVIPEDEVPWHGEVLERMRVEQDEEFHRTGFLRRDDEWIPIFFLRRFEMMHNVYQHYLVIKGEPGDMHTASGVESEEYGTVIANEGYDLYMPTVASVARDEKEMDEEEALQLATIQLETYGFEDVIWFDMEEERRGTVASEWQVEDED